MSIVSFLEKNSEIKPFVIKTEGESSKWGRLVCHWQEKETGYDHIFTPLVNLKNGDVYLDCSKKKIYAKFIAHSILRPFHIVFKTIFHFAIPISIPYVVYDTIHEGKKNKLNGNEIAKNCFINTAKSLADIARTPLYGTAMHIVNIAAVIIGPLAPKTLYTFREWTGHLVQSLNWRDDFVSDFFACFQPIDKVQNLHRWNKNYDDTIYMPNPNINKDHLKGLTNFARCQIRFRREHYSFFNNPFGKLDPTIRFISPSYGDVEKTTQKGH